MTQRVKIHGMLLVEICPLDGQIMKDDALDRHGL